MTTVTDANVHNLALRGTFDDCQDAVKALFADTEFNARHRLGAVNSINWARILAQTVYYFHAYLALVKAKGEGVKVQFVVPTGNFGDVLAGWYATRMGLPTGAPLGIATNSNDILARFWATGVYATAAEESTPEGTYPSLVSVAYISLTKTTLKPHQIRQLQRTAPLTENKLLP